MHVRLELVDERLDVKPKTLFLGEPGPGSSLFCEPLCTRVRRMEGTGKGLAICGVHRTILTLQNILVVGSRSKTLLDLFITACLGVTSERNSHLAEREAASAKQKRDGFARALFALDCEKTVLVMLDVVKSARPGKNA